MYYSNAVSAVRQALKLLADNDSVAPGSVPVSHLLWMCDEIEKMDISSADAALKAARWIGWILAHVEIRGIWKNSDSRNIIRLDKLGGLDSLRENNG